MGKRSRSSESMEAGNPGCGRVRIRLNSSPLRIGSIVVVCADPGRGIPGPHYYDRGYETRVAQKYPGHTIPILADRSAWLGGSCYLAVVPRGVGGGV
eukprot:2677467-Pyramimonas_sp.AAC.1